jgi:flavodoxin
MRKVLIGYATRTGNTRKMADYIAEGVRFTGNQADVHPISEIKSEADLQGYDAYIFGCPTYHRDMIGTMKTFLFLAEKANLVGKIGGAFCSFTHSGEAGPMVFDTMLHVYKMDMIDLGALNLKEQMLGSADGIRACQQYGKAVGEKLAV